MAFGYSPASSGVRQKTGSKPSAAAPNVSLKLVTNGLSSPVGITLAGDGSNRIFVIEQNGRVRIVRNGKLKTRVFLDLTDLTDESGEQGLLGIAFHPDYESNRLFYVHYTNSQGDTEIAEYMRSKNYPGRANPNATRTILTIDDPYSNHNGGTIAFGLDGYLYIGTGDGGGGGDPDENGQSLTTLFGKILRVDVNTPSGELQYSVPTDNPFVNQENARGEIWSYGLRNPWQFNFDATTGDLWIGDVGQDMWEEIDVERSGSTGGLNFGWDLMEGNECFEPDQGCDRAGLTMPVAVYRHDEGCSVTGGVVYRGTKITDLEGTYLYGDYCSGNLWGLSAADPPIGAEKLLNTEYLISAFGTTRAGEVLVADHSGKLLKIVAAASQSANSRPQASLAGHCQQM
jgi:glucose/arabinose dehydrogenase